LSEPRAKTLNAHLQRAHSPRFTREVNRKFLWEGNGKLGNRVPDPINVAVTAAKSPALVAGTALVDSSLDQETVVVSHFAVQLVRLFPCLSRKRAHPDQN
jgi:hypothetical protein